MVIEIKPIRDIPFFKNYVKAKPIFDGLSNDIKYIVWVDNKKYILKLSEKGLVERKREELKYNKLLKKINVPKCYGAGEVAEYSYIIYDYIDGEIASIGLKRLTLDEQYDRGVVAGKTLKGMHKETNGDLSIDIKASFNEIALKIKDLDLPCYDKMISLFNQNIDMAINDGSYYCHGDYHTNNMIVNYSIFPIDFEGLSIMPKYFDFRRMFTFSRSVSVNFCKGMLDGYFGNKLSDVEFKMMIPFLIYDLFLNISLQNDRGSKLYMELFKLVLEDFNNFETVIPNWYYFIN